jgi:hypothetical protein
MSTSSRSSGKVARYQEFYEERDARNAAGD